MNLFCICRGIENRTQASRSQTVNTTIMLYPDGSFVSRPKSYHQLNKNASTNLVCYTVAMKLFVGAKGLILNKEGKILIVKEADQYIDGEGCCPGQWDLVGGRIESEESLFEGLEREIMEESGLQVTVGELLGVAENFPVMKGEKVHIVRVYYVCTTEDDEVKLSSDHDEYRWVLPSECDELPLMQNIVEMFKKYKTTI
jgi:8-oxo-dGTP diphosphatase